MPEGISGLARTQIPNGKDGGTSKEEFLASAEKIKALVLAIRGDEFTTTVILPSTKHPVSRYAN